MERVAAFIFFFVYNCKLQEDIVQGRRRYFRV